MYYNIYKFATRSLTPFIPALLQHRIKQGKEDVTRLPERQGFASCARPAGKLVWIHAASVGEANSVLPLIETILKTYTGLHILLTTVTVTSAKMMENRLPTGAFHQFAPVDTPAAVEKFLNHWQPDLALWVDSEFWPNTLMQTQKHGIAMGIINARMSEKSFHSWRFAKGFIRDLLTCFTLCFAQSQEDSDRLLQLGIPSITAICNLKYDAPALPYDEQELTHLHETTAGRALWLAASTHPGEEAIIAQIHKMLKKEFPNLLTLIVPRHAKRGDTIMTELSDMKLAQRSKGDTITEDSDIYIADTMGELGLFYRLANIAFIAGTLVPHGGQNPLEAARIGCAIITGPHTDNFRAVIQSMQESKAILTITTQNELLETLRELLHSGAMQKIYIDAALQHAGSKGGAIDKIMNELQRYLN